MELLSGYYVKAIAQDRAAFAARYPHPFLLKHPVPGADKPAPADPFAEDGEDSMPATRIVGGEAEGMVFDEQGPMAAEWRVAALVRTLNAPPKDRIVVGRSKVLCDVVLPFASVSKVHAHFHLDGSTVAAVSDMESSNGTAVNGVRLSADARTPVKLGDRIRLGTLELELVDAGQLYDVLTAEG